MYVYRPDSRAGGWRMADSRRTADGQRPDNGRTADEWRTYRGRSRTRRSPSCARGTQGGGLSRRAATGPSPGKAWPRLRSRSVPYWHHKDPCPTVFEPRTYLYLAAFFAH